MKCYFCRKPSKLFICKDCQKQKNSDDKRRTPMTEWQKTKLGFYRSEKKWLENIKNRKIVNKQVYLTDSRGNIKGLMPTA